ncbi:MAG: NAD(P)-binding domain-containing protein [Hyphomicrobiaceae bacterium]
MTDRTTIGLLGLGPLGRGMFETLSKAGRQVVAFDASPAARASIAPVPPGCDVVPSLFDLATDADIVLSTLTDAPALTDAVMGDADVLGLGPALKPGAIVAHFGRGPHAGILKLTGLLGARGVGLIDVFTCQPLDHIRNGSMKMLAGGFTDLVERFAAAVAPLGTVERIGVTGIATGLGALRGYVRAARLIALSEAMLIGQHAGIAPDVLAETFDGPIGSGPDCCGLAGLSHCEARERLRIDDIYRHASDAVGFAERVGVASECVSFSRDLLSDAMAVISGDDDESSLLKHFEAILRAAH